MGSPLFHAAGFGHRSVVEYLWEQDDRLINICDKWKKSPWLAAAQNGHYEVAAILLNLGAQYNKLWNRVLGDKKKLFQIFNSTCMHGELESVKFLLSKRPEIYLNQT